MAPTNTIYSSSILLYSSVNTNHSKAWSTHLHTSMWDSKDKMSSSPDTVLNNKAFECRFWHWLLWQRMKLQSIWALGPALIVSRIHFKYQLLLTGCKMVKMSNFALEEYHWVRPYMCCSIQPGISVNAWLLHQQMLAHLCRGLTMDLHISSFLLSSIYISSSFVLVLSGIVTPVFSPPTNQGLRSAINHSLIQNKEIKRRGL